MNTPTLSHLTLQTLDNYRAAANQAVLACRIGGHRLVTVVNATLENSVYPRTAKLAPYATRRIDGVRGNVSEVVVKGIDQVAQRTEQAIELSSSAAAAQVKKVVRFATGIDNDIVAVGLQAAARLTVPGAKVALVLSGKVAEGAQALAGVAGARPLRASARTSVRTPVMQAAGKAAPKAVRTATAQVKRQVAPVARRAKAAVEVSRKRVVRAVKTVKAPAAPVVRAKSAAKRAARKITAAAKAA